MPASGTYVFTWTVVGDIHSYFVAELVVDGVRRGMTLSDAEDADLAVGTTVVLVTVNAGDHVFVRKFAGDDDKCQAVNADNARNTFSGWLLF